ncbi:hypothetical protein [Agrobacterium sp. DE0009]|uniref:hypothetical protein n=1 Tax=Agrobacterium sp. DE0009 TaxID=2587505 RepID=UPI00119E4125|nr:hypothetical protein [Agrobacterium sp. DE0009]
MEKTILDEIKKTALVVIFIASSLYQVHAAESNINSQIDETKRRFEDRLASGQYMKSSCEPIRDKDWTGVDLLRCTYQELGAEATVTLALPTATQLARWTIYACLDAGAKNIKACSRHIEKRIWQASNGQFPVNGYVIEPHSVIGGASNKPYCFLFRDGVTVRTGKVTSRPPQNGKCAPQAAENDEITRAFTYARVASTTRAEFALATGAPPVTELTGTAFPDAVRREMVAAWGSNRNRLISGAAVSDRIKGMFD